MADGVADAAADVDEAKRLGVACRANGAQERHEQFVDARTVIKLLGEPLHFPVNRDEETVDGGGGEKAVARRQRLDDAKRLAIAERCERGEDIRFANGNAFEREGMMLNDQIGNFGLRWIPGG